MRWIWVIFLIPVFYWLTGGKINLNLLELWYKLNDFIDKNYDLGGWHRLSLVFGIGIVMYAGIVTFAYFGEKRKEIK